MLLAANRLNERPPSQEGCDRGEMVLRAGLVI